MAPPRKGSRRSETGEFVGEPDVCIVVKKLATVFLCWCCVLCACCGKYTQCDNTRVVKLSVACSVAVVVVVVGVAV